MKKAFSFFSIIIVLIAVVLSIYLATRDEKLEIGYAKENISPVLDGEIIPVPLGGYAGLRLADSIESDIYAICTAFRDNSSNMALIYSIDSIGITTAHSSEIIKTISENVGVPEENIILNCTHNHASPELNSTISESHIYKELLTSKLLIAAKNAIDDLSICTKLYISYLDIPDFSYIRREDNTSIDPSVPVARFSRKDKKDILLINWAAHCDTVAGSSPTAISSDYIGVIRDTLEIAHGIDVSIQMGACGDVNPACFFEDEHKYIGKEKYGKALAQTISSQLKNLTRSKIVSKVDSIRRTVSVKVDHSNDDLVSMAEEIRSLYYANRIEEYNLKCKEYGIATIYEATSIVQRSRAEQYKDITLCSVSVGNLVFAAAPYEMFAINGSMIKNSSPFDLTFVMGYSNGKEGYIPADYAYSVGGYEVYSSWFEKGSAELLQAALSDMISELSDADLCRHNFVTAESDANFHLLKCSLCELKFANPTKHSFDEDYVCSVCNEHIHKNEVLKGFPGITMSCIGDSITMGAEIEKPYVDSVKELLGLKESHNYGVSWSTIGHKENCDCDHPYLSEDYNHDPMVYRYAEIKNSDIIFIQGGLNDFGVDLPLGSIDDMTPNTFYGALNILLSEIKGAYPDSYIFMTTGLNYFDGYTNGNGETWEAFNNAIREMCMKHNIDCLDMYNIPFNRLVDTVDYVHPTQDYATNVIAPKIAQFIEEKFGRYYYYDGCFRCTEHERVYYDNLFVDTIENHGKICTYDLHTKQFIEKESPSNSYTLIDVTGMKEIRFAFTNTIPSAAWSYFFYDENGKFVGGSNMPSGLIDVYAKVPTDAVCLAVLYSPKHPYSVYQSG